MEAEKEIRRLKLELERRVLGRTAELETVKKTLEAEVAERRRVEMKFREILESAPDAIVIVDRKGRIDLVNAQTERLFGYPRAELIGAPIELLVPQRFQAEHPKRRDGYFSNPRNRPMGSGLELFGQRKDGSEFPVEVSLSPMVTEEGTLVSASVRDITERRRIEEALEKASRLKSEFLANMSHELRTPLNGIIGFSELIYDGKAGPLSADQKEYMGDVLTSAKHLLRLINDILDLAKVESGKMEFLPEPVDLTKVVEETRDVLRTVSAKKEIEVIIQIDRGLGPVVIDPGKLKQVLYNYLSNALKFTEARGSVMVRITPEGTEAFRLEVEDTGIGILPEELIRLFTEFQQLDATVAKRYPGTGLGLALTRRIVEAQGGIVGVRSVPGKGSVFFAVFPRVARKGAADEKAERALAQER